MNRIIGNRGPSVRISGHGCGYLNWPAKLLTARLDIDSVEKLNLLAGFESDVYNVHGSRGRVDHGRGCNADRREHVVPHLGEVWTRAVLPSKSLSWRGGRVATKERSQIDVPERGARIGIECIQRITLGRHVQHVMSPRIDAHVGHIERLGVDLCVHRKREEQPEQ